MPDTLPSLPVRLLALHACQNEAGQQVLIEFRHELGLLRLALSVEDARLLMEHLGAVLTHLRLHPSPILEASSIPRRT